MVKLIHADGFFPPGDAEKYKSIVENLNFVQTKFGLEVPNFNMILPKIEPLLSRVLGERVIVDSKRSGVFRKPINNVIHFEDFESLNEWCFLVALEETTLNLCYHISDHTLGELSPVDAHTALDGTNFDYFNFFEWKIHTNVILQPNDGIFIRPWVFRTLYDGLVQYYRLIADRKFRVLVMGLPGSDRKTVSKNLNELIPNSTLLKSLTVRKELKDLDFSYDGRMRQTYRILNIARQKKEEVVIIDMACPYPEMIEVLNPDVVIWASKNKNCKYIETLEQFVPPKLYDVKCDKITSSTYSEIIERIMSKKL
jgi:hypothetical protein